MQKTKISETIKEYGRGVVGGLLFSLPLLYTMEVWWTGFIASPEKLVAFIIFTFLLLLGYNRHAGMKPDTSFKEILHESVEDIALAFLVAFLFLLLISKVDFSMSISEIAGKVIVESMIVAIGVSVGTAQLGDQPAGSKEDSGDSKFLQMIVLAICGAALISSSVAPTEEILDIAIISDGLELLFMILVSLLISGVILFYSDFKGTGSIKGGFGKVISHLVINYFIALIVSLMMLWFFGRIGGYGLSIVIAQTIVLAIPASLGASAGRLLIESKNGKQEK